MDDLTRLFLAARDGDRASLQDAIRRSQADVWRFAAHLVGPADADDVTQDTYLRAWRALPAFRADSGARTWLLSIARRAAADQIRHHQRRRRVDERARETVGPGWVDDSHQLLELVDLLDHLDANQRDAFVLTQVIGLSYAETADVCDVRIGTVRSRVARARAALIDELESAREIGSAREPRADDAGTAAG